MLFIIVSMICLILEKSSVFEIIVCGTLILIFLTLDRKKENNYLTKGKENEK